MASENTAIVTPSTTSPAAVAYHATQDTRPLKRPRETTPSPSPSSAPVPDISPSKIARLAEYTTQAFVPLTGAAALEERRQRRAEEQRQGPPGVSSNPTQQALNHLMSGATATMSRPQDTRTEAASHSDIEAAAVAAARALGVVQMPPDNMSEGQEVSPHSTAGGESGVSMEDGDSQVVHSPHQMDMDGRADPRLYAPQPEAPMDDKAVAASFSYPGPPAAMTAPPPRGMSMPMPNTQNPELVGRSPSSNKRHKCDECQTEFTRHHNLKSHMLTHSQEKPYVCQDCNLRFRRLHDLKRHGKLHTGEKPHICPKCDRKFARGDALARHSKGAGGCAGRRPSMGSFPGDEDYQGQHEGDDSAMAGVLYENNGDASMSEDGRGLSLPSIKAQHAPGQGGQEGFAHSNTYPPTGGRPGGGLFPPNVDRGSAGPAGGPPGGPSNHTAHQIPAASMYAQSGMTESPKPLSPGGGQAGQKRSASGLSLPTHVNAQAGRGRGRPAGGAAQRQEGNGPVPVPMSVPGNNNGTFVGHDTGIVTYFHHLDEKVKALMADAELRNKREAELLERLNAHEHTINTQQESIMMLSNEVASLREQLSGGAQGDGAGQEE